MAEKTLFAGRNPAAVPAVVISYGKPGNSCRPPDIERLNLHPRYASMHPMTFVYLYYE